MKGEVPVTPTLKFPSPIAELALIQGDLMTTRDIFGDLAEFSLDIGEEEIGVEMRERIDRIDQFMGQQGNAEKERTIKKDVQLERIDEIITDLKFSSMKGIISNSEFDMKRDRLEEMKHYLD